MADTEEKLELRKLIYDAVIKATMTPSDFVFASELSKAIKTFYDSGNAKTIDIGTVSAGAFSGAGTSYLINGDLDSCMLNIYNACQLMVSMTSGGNNLLASAIAKGVNLMCTNGTIRCVVIGNAISGTTTVTLTDFAEGNMSLTTTDILQLSLYRMFEEMNFGKKETIEAYNKRLEIGTVYESCEQRFSYLMADYIQTALESGLVYTIGQNTLSGTIGTGAVSFNEEDDD